MKTKKRKIGDIGESIALKFMEDKKYSLVEKNFLKEIGEIDLILKKNKKIFFVEVKTSKIGVKISAEENLTEYKLKKFKRIIDVYRREKKIESISYEIFAIFVYLDTENKKAKVKLLKEIF